MKIVVDTNIVFSCLLHSNGRIGEIIFNSSDIFEFYSCDYMRFEIRKHWAKLKKISKLSDTQLQDSCDKTFTHIRFVNEELIKPAIWLQSEKLVESIDPDDISFVALTRYLKGSLWTGDKKLYEGLKERKFNKVFTTEELFKLLVKGKGK